MADEGTPPAKRVRLTKDNLKDMSREELLEKCQEQEAYIDAIMSNKRPSGTADELVSLRESEEKLKQQQQEAAQRENMLVMRLSSKEQEMQDYIVQIQELKQAQNPSAAKLRAMMLDPAVNLMFERMKKEVESCKEKLEQAQNDLAAWKFTPDSQTGKRLMAKCRMLLTENEELGKVISSGRTAKLESEIALEKKFVEEMKLSQAEMDEFLVDMDEDVEGMQSTICLLQQQLKEAKELVSKLQAENAKMCAQVANSQQQLQPLPQQQPQQYGCAHTTDDSSSVERTTDAALTTPEGVAAAARTTHTPPCVLAANNNNTATVTESRGSTDVDMVVDNNRVSTPQTPPSAQQDDVSVDLHAAPPTAHNSTLESRTQSRDVHNGNRTADDRHSVVGHATNNRTEDDVEMVECPTTNGQVPHESDLPQYGHQLGDRTEVSTCRYDNDDVTETSRRNLRLHDDVGGGLKGSALLGKVDDSRHISRSPTADYETEETDLSSDTWSPRSPLLPHRKGSTRQLRDDTAVSDDDDASPLRQLLRTDAKSGTNSDVMPNGVVVPQTLAEEQDT